MATLILLGLKPMMRLSLPRFFAVTTVTLSGFIACGPGTSAPDGGTGGSGPSAGGTTHIGTGGASASGGATHQGSGGNGQPGTGGSLPNGTGGSGNNGSGGNPASGGSGPDTGGSGSETGGSGQVVAGCETPTDYPNLFVTVSGHTQEESDAKVADAWSKLFNSSSSGKIYFDGPGGDESYVKDIWNGDVRSEGMSYGMMVAVQLDHQTEFDRLWTWVRNHMAQGCSGDVCTGEIAWSCSTSGNKNSNGGAPDGEEYMATALIFAHNRWGDSGNFDYATEARWVLDIIRTKYFHTDPHLVKFVASSNKTDPSYILPAFYQAWSCFDSDNSDFWDTAVTDGREFFHVGLDGNGTCPYQASWDGSQPQAANSDSVRCVVNLMMDHNFFAADPWQSDTYAPLFASHQGNAGAPQSYCNALLGFGLPAADGKPFVDKLWSANVPNSDYWNGVLYMLALLHTSGNFKLWY